MPTTPASASTRFADLAGDWITINEPWCVSFLSHAWGVQAPGLRDPAGRRSAPPTTRCSPTGWRLQQFRAKAPDARVGITNILSNVNPRSEAPEDVAAAHQLDIRMNRIFLEPCYHGEYPDDVVAVFAADGLNAGEADGALVQPGDLAADLGADRLRRHQPLHQRPRLRRRR